MPMGPPPKLSAEDARAIRAAFDAGTSQPSLAVIFGVHKNTIHRICSKQRAVDRRGAGRDAPAAAGQPSRSPEQRPAATISQSAGDVARAPSGGADLAHKGTPGGQPIPRHIAAIVANGAHRCPRTGRAPTPREAMVIWEQHQRRKALRRGEGLGA